MNINLISYENKNLNHVIIISIILQFILTYSYEFFGYIGPWLSLLSLFLILRKNNYLEILGLKWEFNSFYLFLVLFELLDI
ncbi:hypothetical protein AXG55_01875 [Silvanigrella aquatica]|uniref:Uncharacterized protein n=1 Tax=Silvanigrella aquatica TaxID=1915309 RepID=A0A1L4CXR6_9BACT|nr:hypothetical protein AXG55_01875 [Silvanigrella aquatica]